MRNTLSVAAALLGCALLTSGCSALTGGYSEYTKPLTESQLIGHWVSNCKAVLTVNADHTLTATGYPTGADVNGTITGTVSGHGTWIIRPAFGDTIPQAMDITVGADGDSLEPAINNGSLLLVDTLGDPDDGNACNFTRG